MSRRPAAAAAMIFAGVASLLVAFHASRLIFSPDEGIILEAAQRMLGGKKLYADFFGYMSPGSYWLEELVFRCLGLSLRAGRLVVILDFALQCALVFWLIARAGYWKAAWAATVLFFCFEAGNPALILPGHRWDSAALSLLSVALCIHGAAGGRRAAWMAAGALAAFAAFCTPSIAILVLITGVALVISKQRRFLLFYVVAAAATAACLLVSLWVAGILRPFAAQMLWLAGNYSRVNVTPYGWPLGGYAALFADLAREPLLVRPLLLLTDMLPAVLPVAAVLGWGAAWALHKAGELAPPARFPVTYLAACLAGYILSTQPRPDLTHLTIVAPAAYVLITILICTYLAPLARVMIFILILPWALLLPADSVAAIAAARPVPTPVGTLRAAPQEEAALRTLLSTVRPGESLYVHPYLPLFYFLTQGINPTRFSYLAPGMMGAREEQSVLRDLERSPPDWVLYLPLRAEDYVKVFPSAAGMRAQYEAIEAWIQANYAPIEPPLWISGYQLLARQPPPAEGRGIRSKSSD